MYCYQKASEIFTSFENGNITDATNQYIKEWKHGARAFIQEIGDYGGQEDANKASELIWRVADKLQERRKR
jgi:hypothetical protein